MGGLIFILPILALDIWLCCTAGQRQLRRWVALKQWRNIILAGVAGMSLGVWFTFFLHYGRDIEIRKGFPIPLFFFRAEDSTWARATVPAVVFYAGAVTDFLTGLAAPAIPFKISEFLKQVKAEMK